MLHLVAPSPWPVIMAASTLFFLLNLILGLKSKFGLLGIISLLTVGLVLFFWLRDVLRESVYLGKNSKFMKHLFVQGYILFLVSEVILFFRLFWTYFHFSLSPDISIGCVWPPTGVRMVRCFRVPLLNTGLLLLSGVRVTIAHIFLSIGTKSKRALWIAMTVLLGLVFELYQYLEYNEMRFRLADSCYGNIFFALTGLHGIHVLLGILGLSISLATLINNFISTRTHLSWIFPIWYWHFVDVVWLLVYLVVYVWGR